MSAPECQIPPEYNFQPAPPPAQQEEEPNMDKYTFCILSYVLLFCSMRWWVPAFLVVFGRDADPAARRKAVSTAMSAFGLYCSLAELWRRFSTEVLPLITSAFQ